MISREKENNLKRKYECDICGQIFYRRILIIHHFKTSFCFPESPFDFENDFCKNSKNSIMYNMNYVNNCIANNTNKNNKFKVGQSVIQNKKFEKSHKILHTKDNNLKYDFCLNLNNTTYENTHCLKKKYKWICNTCGQSFRKLSLLNTHKSIHLKNEPFNCNESYISLTSLEKHKVNNIFSCDICHKQFSELSLLTTHKKMHKLNSINHCYICQKHFTSKSSLTKHISRIHDSHQNFECSKCSKIFHNRSEIVNHIFNYHQEDYSIFSCDPCSELYGSSQELVLHLETNVLKCDICPQSFITSYRLHQHYKWHLGINSFKCQYCPKTFSKCSVYFSHERTHTGEKPFRCNFCGKWFPVSSNFNIHLTFQNPFEYNSNQKIKKPMHSKVNKLKSKCYNKLFSQSAVNTKIHTSKKSYECNVCQKSFILFSALNSHLKTHTNQQFQKCNITDNILIKSHLNKQSANTDYGYFKCQLCEETFLDQNIFISHKCSSCYQKIFNTTFTLEEKNTSYKLSVNNNINATNNNCVNEEYKCDLCMEIFSNKSQICSHILETHY